MSGKKIISLDGLQGLVNKLKSIFVVKVDGKDLSSNDFTSDYKDVCDYTVPLKDDGLLSLAMKGPDGKVYRLALNDEFRLVLKEYVISRQVKYLISGEKYYYLKEDESGVYLSEYTGEVEEEECGYVRAISNDTGMKFTLNVVNDEIVFNLYQGTGLDRREAKYMACNDKLYYFEIEDDQVQMLYEYLTIEMNDIELKK